MASAVLAALAVLGKRLEPSFSVAAVGAGESPDEAMLAHSRASRAVAVLAEYVEGLPSLANCAPMVEDPTLWVHCCRDSADGSTQALPWALLHEVAVFVIWRPMQDDAMALVPPTQGNIKPSEAVLVAESNAKKLMQLPSTWARYLEDKGGSRLVAVWLACVDATCEAYWKKWDALVDTFENTLKSRASEGSMSDGSIDAGLLNECMQLHSMLHDNISVQFLSCQLHVLQLATRMRESPETPLGRALEEKLRGPDAWCDRLAVPSAEALRGASSLLQGLGPEHVALTTQATKALPLSTAALGKVVGQVRALVTRCCVQPIVTMLSAYAEAHEWVAQSSSDVLPLAGGRSPLPSITAVGEHLFALMPLLERPQEGSHKQVQWLPSILDGIVETVTQKVLNIRQLTPNGAQQLIADLEYLHKVTEALGSDSSGSPSPSAAGGAAAGAAWRLGETLGALGFLAAQQRRQQECAAKGEAFIEAPREGTPAPRRVEKALRAALGLAPAVGLA